MLGPSRLHPVSGHRLCRDLQSDHQAHHGSHSALSGSLSPVSSSPTRCQERLPPWHLDGDRVCSSASGFEDPARLDFVCCLNKSLYGLKQAPRAWYSRLATHLVSLGFVEAKSDTSLFVYRRGPNTAYLLLYVDDIVLTASSTHLLRQVISALQQEFAMKDLGKLHHFLGMQVQRSADGMVLSQRQYMIDILDHAGMAECKPCTTPVDTSPKVSANPSDYQSLVGALQYLTFTRSDIAYAVQQVCLYMHDPRETHLAALKRILRYIRGTLHLGLHLRPLTQDDLVVYSDAD
jgi:hypothetical protein